MQPEEPGAEWQVVPEQAPPPAWQQPIRPPQQAQWNPGGQPPPQWPQQTQTWQPQHTPVNNIYLWLLTIIGALSPLVLVFGTALLENKGGMLPTLLALWTVFGVLAWLDQRKVADAGYGRVDSIIARPSPAVAVILLPAYLYVRRRQTSDNQMPLITVLLIGGLLAYGSVPILQEFGAKDAPTLAGTTCTDLTGEAVNVSKEKNEGTGKPVILTISNVTGPQTDERDNPSATGVIYQCTGTALMDNGLSDIPVAFGYQRENGSLYTFVKPNLTGITTPPNSTPSPMDAYAEAFGKLGAKKRKQFCAFYYQGPEVSFQTDRKYFKGITRDDYNLFMIANCPIG